MWWRMQAGNHLEGQGEERLWLYEGGIIPLKDNMATAGEAVEKPKMNAAPPTRNSV